MKEAIISYTSSLINDVPHCMYEGLLSAMCIGTVLLLAWRGRSAWRYISGLLLVEYSFLLYCSTVIFRKPMRERACELMPFWSYKAIMDGKDQYLVENFMNVVVFVPLGLLLSCVSRRLKWWMVLLIGFGISLSIESMQFVMKRGFSEFDDVMHNTLGCAIGLTLISIPMFMIRKVKKQ